MNAHRPGCPCFVGSLPHRWLTADAERRVRVKATANLRHEAPKPRTDFAIAA